MMNSSTCGPGRMCGTCTTECGDAAYARSRCTFTSRACLSQRAATSPKESSHAPPSPLPELRLTAQSRQLRALFNACNGSGTSCHSSHSSALPLSCHHSSIKPAIPTFHSIGTPRVYCFRVPIPIRCLRKNEGASRPDLLAKANATVTRQPRRRAAATISLLIQASGAGPKTCINSSVLIRTC
jgi:hypothetical protein